MSKRIELLDKAYLLKEIEGIREHWAEDENHPVNAGALCAIAGITALIQSMKPIKIVCPLCCDMEVEDVPVPGQ